MSVLVEVAPDGTVDFTHIGWHTRYHARVEDDGTIILTPDLDSVDEERLAARLAGS